MSDIVLSVSQLNEYVRGLLALDPLLSRVSLRGELSGVKRHTSGHVYFTLKDETSVVRCVMFRQHAQTLGFAPMDGLHVVLGGYASVYVRDGSYQFYAERMRADGEGELYRAFLAMRNRLEQEGLFEAERKRPLPVLPVRIGIVTSETGAAVRDFIRVARRRNPGVNLLLSPALVQGEGAPESIVKALKALDGCGCDVIIVGRGGGSMEDLWAFNAEEVARAIVACPVPVISAVGHEVDTTIADYAADVRAPTPSAAAELCVPELETLQGRIDELRHRLASRTAMTLKTLRWQLDAQTARLTVQHPGHSLARFTERLHVARHSMGASARALLTTALWCVDHARARLETLNPYSVLARGYAMIERPQGLVTRAEQLLPDERVTLRLIDGTATATIGEIDIYAGGGIHEL